MVSHFRFYAKSAFSYLYNQSFTFYDKFIVILLQVSPSLYNQLTISQDIFIITLL